MYPLLTGRSITRNRHSTGKEEGRMRSLDVCSMSTRSVSIEIPSGTRHEESASHGILKLLRYEAKESMATKMLQQIAQEAMDRHQLLFVRIRHSVGEVPVGDASVLVQVIGIHRKETFEATAEIMDRLKKKVIPNRVGKSYSIPLSGSYMEAGGLGVGCDMERRECRRSICMRYNWTVFRSFTAD
mmetsp:Transcript_28687/g.92550  ORF Transcript_28687/g.92550 Transcript_28687/m.92550 type:complete len:185 (-) Transcript_28687:252-806(-)